MRPVSTSPGTDDQPQSVAAPVAAPVAQPDDLPIDTEYLRERMLELLLTPSPSGRTDAVMQVVGDRITELGVPFDLTRRGMLRARIAAPGDDSPVRRAVVVHADTIGCMVKRVKDDGRLEVVQVGTHSARFSEGAHVTVLTDDPDAVFTGTILPLLSSGHTFGDQVDTQGVGWHQVEVRLDEHVASAADTERLGICVGDFVALDADPRITPGGFVKSRHLDDKAGLAACLAAVKAVVDHGAGVPVPAQLLVTIGEEVGFGATHGIGPDVAELLAVDNAVVAKGQQSCESAATVALMDMTGPFDYHLTRRLLALGAEHDVPVRRDVFTYYRSDAAPALEAGVEARAALVGAGVESSHGHERTHLDGLTALARLLTVYLQSELTFADWDRSAAGPLEAFPSVSVQPAPREPAPHVP